MLFRWMMSGLAGLVLLSPCAGAADTDAGSTPAKAAAAGFGYLRVGEIGARASDPTQTALLLAGGGELPRDSLRWFADKSGHGGLVILRASEPDPQQGRTFLDAGFTSVQTLTFHDRQSASDPKVLGIIEQADAIFIAGGDQSRYVRFWKDTPLSAALDAHVKGGKPIGGSSAGLAILGAYGYGALDGGSLISGAALMDPAGAQVTLVRNFLHMPFLGQVITDTHFAKRNRLGRLIVFVARLAQEEHDAAITGVGVDEGAVLGVDQKGIGRVFSTDGGHAWLVRPLHAPDVLSAGKPLQMRAFPIVAVGPEGRLDLNNFSVSHPAFQFNVQVSQGVLIGNDRTPAARADSIPHWALAVHGGAGVIERGDLTPQLEANYRAGIAAALDAGSKILRAGGSSLDAVEAAVRQLEDNPLFNAGKGAVFTAEGRNELDASIMDGRTLKAGAIAGVTRTKNPISLARAVMEKSEHVLLSGAGADAFSKEQGLEQVDPRYFRTEERWKQYLEWRTTHSASRDRTHLYGTVGAVALDENGHLAAATSTGGLTGKRWGRIGDSPIIGAGTYAEDGVAAVSATGTGEYFIRASAARQIRDRMQWEHDNVQEALDDTIENIESLGGDGALMGMDGRGRTAFSMNSIGMYRGWTDSATAPRTAIYSDERAAP